MISDEGQKSAAYTMSSAAELNMRAANIMSESVHTLQILLGEGYGNNIEQLIAELRRFNDNKERE